MEFASGLSVAPDGLDDVAAMLAGVRDDLGGVPTLVAVFASADFGAEGEAESLSALVAEVLAPENLVGATAQGVVSGHHEIEHAPAVSVWAVRAPALEVDTGHVSYVEADAGSFVGLPLFDGVTTAMLVLTDPYTFPADTFLDRINQDQPGLACFGGLASGGRAPGESVLFCGKEVHRSGAVVAALAGPVEVHTLVSQGCRPIGRPFLVTAAERNVILELGGRPALERLTEIVTAMSPDEQALIEGGIHVGRVVDEHKAEFGRGDFLIRNLVGADRDSGAIAIGDVAEVGATVQFHVRDAVTAEEDLSEMLAGLGPGVASGSGALLFTCNGRGRRFFTTPDHDAAAVTEALGSDALGGFFCAGEIGPIGGANHLHGYTASVGIFRPAPLENP